jgi:hypothetical protein
VVAVYVLWRLWRRDRRTLTDSTAVDEDPEAAAEAASRVAIAEVLLERAGTELDLDLGAADTIDLKAVGLATAAVAALTILVTFHRDLPAWWLHSTFIGISAVCFFLVLWQRDWQYAPEIERFREDNYGRPRVEILEEMLGALVEYRQRNKPYLLFKAWCFQLGYFTLAIGVVTLLAASLWRVAR